ncbi:AlpA family transcriptional regulator [uncultured Oxalicibacterium sp.]|uniref:helix-turn-helix transcriptional regulator n=1 Tax=uncultured Oxalicibacterium sp. TaxID=1168540 RepID=UPI0025D3D7FF|nr:AlpA family transcriptional regulator [uncultured Oxalicibacterium sp.]
MTFNTERFLKLPEVLKILPVSRATFYAGIKDGRYPSPVKLGPRAVAWRLSDIDAYINSLETSSSNSY